MDRREALKVRDRFETAHLALAVAGRLMRHFDAIVRIRGCAVQDRRDQGTAGGLIARQIVGDQAARDGALCFQELAEESDRSSSIPSGLHEDVDHIPILVPHRVDRMGMVGIGGEFWAQVRTLSVGGRVLPSAGQPSLGLTRLLEWIARASANVSARLPVDSRRNDAGAPSGERWSCVSPVRIVSERTLLLPRYTRSSSQV